MPFETPTLPTLNDQAAANIEAELPGTNARLRRSNLNVLARVMAGFAHGFYGYLRRFLEECLPWSKGFLLEMWAGIWGVYRKPAAAASGNVTFTGVDGSVIAAGTELQSTDGAVYETTADGTIAADAALVPVIASEPGKAGNLAAGTVLTLINPVEGVDGNATVDADGVTNGSDIESLDDFYNRFLKRVRSPAHGGNAADYENWALELAGVTRAWAIPAWFGIGSVLVVFVRDDDEDIIPNAAAIAQVQAHIDQVRPVTADVTVGAPVVKVVDFTIELIPDSVEGRAAVEANIDDLFVREAEAGATLTLKHISRDISLADGTIDHVLHAPAENVTCALNEIARKGTITWV